LPLGRIAGDAVGIDAFDARADRLHVHGILRLGKATGEFVQRFVAVQMQQK